MSPVPLLTSCRVLPVFLALAAVAALGSCSSVSKGPGGQFTKVKTYHLIPGLIPRAVDPSIAFERDYRLYGAVTAAEQIARAGQYYMFQWKATDRSQPVTLKFQYRQAKTGLKVFNMEEVITDVRRHNWTELQVTGDAYAQNGSVSAWKATLERDGQVLASQQSYLWE